MRRSAQVVVLEESGRTQNLSGRMYGWNAAIKTGSRPGLLGGFSCSGPKTDTKNEKIPKVFDQKIPLPKRIPTQ